MAERKTNSSGNGSSLGCIFMVLIVFIIFGGLISSCSIGSSSHSKENTAKVCAVKAVQDTLLAPSSAEFCSYPAMTATDLGGNKWRVSGYVDAQNAFGVSLRKYWTVTLTLTGSGFRDADVDI